MNTLDGLPDFPFSVVACDGAARAGLLETPRGTVQTPCFMPVGTKGTVKAIAPERLRAVGAQIILANTYHLALRPGSETVRRLGGLHEFMQWDGPILTDSGGYQVFSLRATARIDDSGVEFRSIYDGSKHVFSPERAMAEQAALGADMVMCLDQCPPGTATATEVDAAVKRTLEWAARCKRAHLARGGEGSDGPQMLLGIAQGGVLPDLRRESAERLVGIGFPGYAIGGLTVGEDREAMLDTTGLTTSVLPPDRLRYFMGIGDPEGLVEVIARGVDIFDCVLPTRTARMGTAFTVTGRLNLRNAEHALSTAPLEEGCPCTACAGFSRGAIRHFVMQKEILGLMLLTEHNLCFLTRLVARAREAIVGGRFSVFRSGEGGS
ncbi:MAG: tRNA guanosine(34) transglycosylase Tgt [Actinobacteria bacterium RBG_16_64_13]|nr:MAG: tRNA guanosine(34) transglycosylase Tgt [Actinobacteria bacterium RBG_16_64_13]